MLEVRLLGTFSVTHQKKAVSIASRPAQSLFAYLILHAGTSHRREKLAGMLWPDSLEETARDNLRHALWRVRKALDSAPANDYLHADDRSLQFEASSDYWLDAAALQSISEGISADEWIAVLNEYKGELLPGFYDEWVVLEREHLSSIFEHHMSRLMSLLQEEKRWLDILDWGERWIKLGQKPEPAYRALMSAHAAKGDMSKVAATYERCVKSLREFGIDPSEQTRVLYEKLKAGKEKLESGSTVPAMQKRKGSVSSPTNLPVPLTSFIGREKEVDQIVRLLGKNRLVTLTGSGGVGKTRLAIQSANRLLSKFKDGVWWADLSGLSDPLLVAHEVAKVVGARDETNQPIIETLVKYFGSKQLLLVLDNCEHLIVACAQLADRLLSACRNLKMLTTSREALDILGETMLPVPSMSLPAVQESFSVKILSKFESVRLFADRAAGITPQFILTEQNAGTIIQICRRLGGMPLAIELAAARVKMMSAGEIAKRLDDRFDLLTAGSRTALPRHQTLRATMDWSYDLLTEAERLLFRRLALFAGGFMLEAAETVCGQGALKRSDVLDLLGRLVDKSLAVADVSSTSRRTRYRLLETIREYAYEKLKDSDEMKIIRLQHLTFFAEMVDEAERNFKGPDQALWYSHLDDELDNLRVSLTWFDGIENAELRLRLTAGLWRYWKNRGQISEGRGHLRRVLENVPPGPSRQTSVYARALTAAGSLAYYAADFLFSEHARKEALSIFRSLDDKVGVADCLNGLGNAAISQGNYDSARIFYEESLTIRKDLGDTWGVARLLGNLGLLAYFQVDYVKARSLDVESLSMFRELGDDEGVANILVNLGDVVRHQGDLSSAYSLYEESAEISREVSDQWGLSYAMLGVADVAFQQGDLSRAASFYRQCLTMFQNGADHVGLPFALESIAALMLAKKQPKKSARIFGAANALRQRTNSPLPLPDSAAYQKNMSILQKQLDRSEFEAAWTEGLTMTLEHAIEYVLKEASFE